MSQVAAEGSVIMLLPSLTMGGTEAQLASLLEASSDTLSRVNVTIVTILPQRNPQLLKRFEALDIGIETIDRSAMSFFAFFTALVSYFSKAKPTIVHAFLGGSTGTWGRLAARVAGVPYILFSDRSLEPQLTRTQRLLDPLVRGLTTRFLPNAQATADRLQRQGVPTNKIFLLRNGVDTERFRPGLKQALRDEYHIPKDAIVAGFLGMLRPEKRPALFLDAVVRLPASSRPDYLLVAGEGEMRRDLELRLANDPWLREHCRLLGVVDDTPTFLASIDFLVLTSDAEGTPNAILEAMASGKPCVATRVSDVPLLLGSEEFLAERGDVSGIAVAIGKMVDLAPSQRTRLGMLGRERVLKSFSLEVAASQFWMAHIDLLARTWERFD